MKPESLNDPSPNVGVREVDERVKTKQKNSKVREDQSNSGRQERRVKTKIDH